MNREELENIGSLITIKGTNTCLGDLVFFPAPGVFDPTHGKVDITGEEANLHDVCLDNAGLACMDANCEVGQGSHAYLQKDGNITTFIGTVVAKAVVKGNSCSFQRAGKHYRGRLRKYCEAFNFKRVK